MKRGGVIVLEGIRTKPEWEAGKPGVKRKASRKEGSGSLDDWKPLGRTPLDASPDCKKASGLWKPQREKLLLEASGKKLKVLSRSP